MLFQLPLSAFFSEGLNAVKSSSASTTEVPRRNLNTWQIRYSLALQFCGTVVYLCTLSDFFFSDGESQRICDDQLFLPHRSLPVTAAVLQSKRDRVFVNQSISVPGVSAIRSSQRKRTLQQQKRRKGANSTKKILGDLTREQMRGGVLPRRASLIGKEWLTMARRYCRACNFQLIVNVRGRKSVNPAHIQTTSPTKIRNQPSKRKPVARVRPSIKRLSKNGEEQVAVLLYGMYGFHSPFYCETRFSCETSMTLHSSRLPSAPRFHEERSLGQYLQCVEYVDGRTVILVDNICWSWRWGVDRRLVIANQISILFVVIKIYLIPHGFNFERIFTTVIPRETSRKGSRWLYFLTADSWQGSDECGALFGLLRFTLVGSTDLSCNLLQQAFQTLNNRNGDFLAPFFRNVIWAYTTPSSRAALLIKESGRAVRNTKWLLQ